MEPTLIVAALKLVGDLTGIFKGNAAATEKLEILKERLNLAKDQVEHANRERDILQARLDDSQKELIDLRERFAHDELNADYETRYNGLLFKTNDKGGCDGPFCPMDRTHMVKLRFSTVVCPKCKLEAQCLSV